MFIDPLQQIKYHSCMIEAHLLAISQMVTIDVPTLHLQSNLPSESVTPQQFFIVQRISMSQRCTFTPSYSRLSIVMFLYENLTYLWNGSIALRSNEKRVTFSLHFIWPYLLRKPTALLPCLFSSISAKIYLDIWASFHTKTFGLSPCRQKASLCTNTNPYFWYQKKHVQACFMPYKLQGQYLSVKMFSFAASLRFAGVTLEISHAYLNQNSLDVIGFSFQIMRSDMTIYCCSLLQYTSNMHLSQLFPFTSQLKTSDPFLSLSYSLQFLMIMTQRLPSGLAATQKSLKLSGTSSMQSVTCSIFLQYLLILLFYSCFFFFLEKLLTFDDSSSIASLSLGPSFCVS